MQSCCATHTHSDEQVIADEGPTQGQVLRENATSFEYLSKTPWAHPCFVERGVQFVELLSLLCGLLNERCYLRIKLVAALGLARLPHEVHTLALPFRHFALDSKRGRFKHTFLDTINESAAFATFKAVIACTAIPATEIWLHFQGISDSAHLGLLEVGPSRLLLNFILSSRAMIPIFCGKNLRGLWG